MESLDRSQLHLSGGTLATLVFLCRPPLISGILFEFPAHSFPQFAGSGVGESDGGEAIHFRLARSDKRRNSAYQRGGLARAGAGRDKKVFIQAGSGCGRRCSWSTGSTGLTG